MDAPQEDLRPKATAGTGVPLYLRIKQDLKSAIDRGELAEGARVPSEFDLAKQYGVSRNPTRQALRELELEGYLTRSRRRGSFVTPSAYRARRFTVSQGRVVACICPHGKSPHVRGIVEGFVHRTGERGSHVLVYFTECTDQNQAELLREIRRSGIAGVALWLSDDCAETLRILRDFKDANFPFVLMDRYVRDADYDCVATDNEYLACTVTKNLIAAGHRHIGFLSNVYHNTANEDRLAGYRRALKEASLPFVDGLVAEVSTANHGGPTEIDRVVAHRSRPTAFFCSQGWIALLAEDLMRRLGYTVPGDMDLGSIDDGEFMAHPDLKVRLARQQSDDMGCQGANLLMDRVDNPHGLATRLLLRPTFNFAET